MIFFFNLLRNENRTSFINQSNPNPKTHPIENPPSSTIKNNPKPKPKPIQIQNQSKTKTNPKPKPIQIQNGQNNKRYQKFIRFIVLGDSYINDRERRCGLRRNQSESETIAEEEQTAAGW